VREVINFRELTPLRRPSFVKGIINLRGEVIPVIDLRRKLGLATKPTRADQRDHVEIGRKRWRGVDDSGHVIRLPRRSGPLPRVHRRLFASM